MKKVFIPVLLAFGIFSGSASAATFTLAPFEILTLGDGLIPNIDYSETDSYGLSAGTDAMGASVSVDHWIGLDVVNGVFSRITAEDQSLPGGALKNLNLEIYTASVVGSDWSDTGLVDFAYPSPLDVSLATGTYLLRFFGELDAGLTDLTHNYGVRITSVVPVPAAAWLFGTAILGFIGWRRKAKTGASA